MYKCYCGHTSEKNLGTHKKYCETLKTKRKEILSQKEMIVNLYLETYNVSSILKELEVDGHQVVSRKQIEDLLKSEGVYEGLTGENYLKSRQSKIEKSMMDKYGVKNYGQLKTSGYTSMNKIDKIELDVFDNYEEWKQQVNKITKKNLRLKEIPEVCEYTGIPFSDTLLDKSNPNDKLKRTVDHKKPILLCYVEGWTPEQTGDVENLSYVLKIVNDLKSNTDFESFQPIIKKLKDLIKIPEKYLLQ